ncbi:MAG: hypothetical protein HOJ56_07000 [Acidimicrobiaceae bacterium]|nr:hypothetical protein [Acidimicrobiaceae bacterium]
MFLRSLNPAEWNQVNWIPRHTFELSPDLGYWAEAVHPGGSLYPMWSTVHVDERWVNVASLPMLYAMLSRYHVGGAFAAGVALIGRLWFLAPRSSLWSRLVPAIPPAGALALSALATMVAIAILEHAMIRGVLRTERSAGTVTAFGPDPVLRLHEAIIIGASAFASSDPLVLMLGIASLALLVAVRRAALNPDAKVAPIGLYTVGLGLIATLLVLDLIIDDGRFIPGLAATTPVRASALGCFSRSGPIVRGVGSAWVSAAGVGHAVHRWRHSSAGWSLHFDHGNGIGGNRYCCVG